MSRRRRRRLEREDTPVVSSVPDPLRTLRSSSVLKQVERRTADLVRSLEDRRFFHPLGDTAPARAARRAASRLVPSVVRKKGRPFRPPVVPSSVRFAVPKKVAVCVRRHQRREVLLALGRGGRTRRGRWSEYSDINCR